MLVHRCLICALVASAPFTANANNLAQDRHARCGLDSTISGAQVGGQQVSSEVILTEPPAADMIDFSCFETIDALMNSFNIALMPSFAAAGAASVLQGAIAGYACNALDGYIDAHRGRIQEFAGIPYGIGGASAGQPLPITITPASTFSAPAQPQSTQTNTVFGGASNSPPTNNSPPPQLPLGGGPNIFGGGARQ